MMGLNTLVSVEDLAAHIDDPTWRLFDCRHDLARSDAGVQAYREGHLPGAQFLHLDRDLSGPRTGTNGRHPLPDPALLAAKLGQFGVTNDTQVIAYDDAGGMYAARLWWLLRWLGHDRVAVLDGGMPAWQRAGHALTAEAPTARPAVLHTRRREAPVDAAYLRTHLTDPQLLLVDARGADRFRGENETLDPVAGHIPRAINRPFRLNLNSDGSFKTAQQLRRELEELLRDRPAQNIVAYCGSGVSACHNLLALEIAGWRGARLYPGSWSEWCSDASRPVATGPD
jgi:thiosulfate/3-mercaptopyruvate sulfurtransferase